MCKLKDILKSGYEDFCSQKKKNRLSFLLMMFSLLIFVGVNSAVNSILKGVNATIYYPEARVATLTYSAEDGDMYEKVKELFKDDDRIEDVFKMADYTVVDWMNTQEYFGEEQIEIKIESFCTPILEYVEQEDIKRLEYNEILIPKYLYDIGKYDEKSYYDGDKLVGKTIELVYNDYNGEEMKSFEVEIVGTYDNVATRVGSDSLYANEEFIDDLNTLSYEAELAYADEYKKDLEEMGMGPDSYVVNVEKKVGIYINKKYDISQVLSDISEETGIYFSQGITVSDETYSFYGYITFVANIVSFMLLVVAFFNIVISSMNEVKMRNWEFALKLSMGYTYKDIVFIFFVEKLINMLKSLVISVGIIAVISLVATVIFKNFMGRYGSMVNFGLDIKYVLLSMCLVAIAALSGVISSKNSIDSIEVAKVLKSGD